MAYLVVKPLIIPILFSLIIAYIAYPLYIRIKKLIKSESWSAFIVAVLIIILISLPIIFVLNAIISQTEVVYTLSRRIVVTGDIFSAQCDGRENFVCNMIKPVQDLIKDPKIKYYLDDGLKTISSAIIGHITDFIFAVPKRILDFFVMLFTVFYLLKGGPQLVDKIRFLLPINRQSCNLLYKRMKDVFYAMIYGYFLIALIQGILGAIGFFAVGIPSAILWGLVMALAALLPVFGTALVWFPASLFLILNGLIENDTTGVWKGLALIAYGILIVSTVDNFLKPKLVSKKAQIHPVVVLIGVIGGIEMFGFVGIIIGPIILAIFITLISIYEKINTARPSRQKLGCAPKKRR